MAYKNTRSTFKLLDEQLTIFLSKRGVTKNLDLIWEKAAPDNVKDTKVLKLEKGILYVTVTNHMLFCLLSRYSNDKNQILKKIQKQNNKITGIKFILG